MFFDKLISLAKPTLSKLYDDKIKMTEDDKNKFLALVQTFICT